MDLTTNQFVLAAVIAVFGTARVTRIATFDAFPPAEWIRVRVLALVAETWGKVVTCLWCAQPYVAAICLAWAYYSDLHWSWWAFWGWMALSQAGSTLLSYDEPE
jgi:hypothetical protein